MSRREIVSRVTNAVLYSDGLIRLDNVRISYPHLDKAWSRNEDEVKKFSMVAMLDKKTHKAARQLVEKRIEELMRENKTERLSADKKFLRDGDLSDKLEYEGYWTVSANETRRPAVRGANNEVLDSDEILNTIYAGCYVSVLIRPWFQDNKFGKRVNSGLVAVKFMRDGEPLGEGAITDDDIDDIYDEFDDSGYDDDDDL